MRFFTSNAERPYSHGMHSLFCGYKSSFPWLRIPLVSSRDLPQVYEAITFRPLLKRRVAFTLNAL